MEMEGRLFMVTVVVVDVTVFAVGVDESVTLR
jgi:hypothetical protein